MTTDVRPMQTVDADAVAAVVEAAFGEDAGRIREVLRRLRGNEDVRLELVAEVDGAVAGHVALSRAWLDTRDHLVEVLVLSPLGVRPEHQRCGVGTALVDAALREAEGLGPPLVFLEGSPDYYGRRGFSRAAGHGVQRPSPRIPDAAAQVALLSSHEAWMTGGLVYPDVWWRLDLVGLRDPVLADLEERAGER